MSGPIFKLLIIPVALPAWAHLDVMDETFYLGLALLSTLFNNLLSHSNLLYADCPQQYVIVSFMIVDIMAAFLYYFNNFVFFLLLVVEYSDFIDIRVCHAAAFCGGF